MKQRRTIQHMRFASFPYIFNCRSKHLFQKVPWVRSYLQKLIGREVEIRMSKVENFYKLISRVGVNQAS